MHNFEGSIIFSFVFYSEFWQKVELEEDEKINSKKIVEETLGEFLWNWVLALLLKEGR